MVTTRISGVITLSMRWSVTKVISTDGKTWEHHANYLLDSYPYLNIGPEDYQYNSAVPDIMRTNRYSAA